VIVLDASALIDVLLDQPNKAAVLAHLEQQIHAPAHQPVEVLSALARLKRAGAIDESVAREAIAEVQDLVQELVIPDQWLLRRALELDGRLRVVDALYVALAERLGCPLVTTDRRLADSNPPCDVVLATVR